MVKTFLFSKKVRGRENLCDARRRLIARASARKGRDTVRESGSMDTNPQAPRHRNANDRTVPVVFCYATLPVETYTSRSRRHTFSSLSNMPSCPFNPTAILLCLSSGAARSIKSSLATRKLGFEITEDALSELVSSFDPFYAQ